jgi:RHS repeat-associated protein
MTLITQVVKAQYIVGPAQLSAPATTPGSYYNESSITLLPGFIATATSTNSYSYFIQTSCVPLSINLSQSQNYILTSVPRDAGIDPAGNNTNCKLMQTVQYFDGLGRLLQTVQIKGSPTSKDIVQPATYDQFGREAKKYLPYAVTNGLNDGSYKLDALTVNAGQDQFYKTPPTGVSVIPYPSASTGFESSPLNRVVEQGAPGQPWQLSASGVAGGGHTVKTMYGSNATGEVVQWTVNTTGTGALGTTSYGANQLYKTTTTDENGNSTIEYKDKKGNVVCKKVQSGASSYLATYYVYDDFDNLCYVIPPIPTGTVYPTSFTESDAIFANFIYGYHYDLRNRQVEKKIPGKGWEYMVYNSLDQVVATQDGNQHIKSVPEWTFTKYDAIGRIIWTGTWNNGGVSIDRPTLQTTITNLTSPLWESRPAGGYPTNVAWPTSGYVGWLTLNYYDDYTFGDFSSFPVAYDYRASASTMTKGLMTCTKTWVLGSAAVLYTLYYYDDLGRTIRIYKEHYLGGTTAVANLNNYDVISNSYNFTNAVTATTRQHYTVASTTSPSVTIANTYAYDDMGRKTKSFEQINSGTNVLLSQTDYNEIGQLQTKHLHSTTGGAPFLQDINYSYNERGWLLGINGNNVSSLGTKYFAEQLAYNLPTHGEQAQYNGNIAEQNYNALNGGSQYVKYSYDGLNRLTDGVNSAGFSESPITYNELGNIISLKRGTATAYGYAYIGNQLQNVTGLTGSTYTYDANGNVKHDGRKNNDIVYNILNLPQTISGNAAITYIYDATGNKLRKISSGSSTDYISGIQYKPDGTIDFIQTEEGRANRVGSNYVYEYTLTDHLGNNRVTFDQSNTRISEDDYYPFGMDVPRFANGLPSKYLYNKKELQAELGQYDYGARFYDPVIARWTSVDPLADMSHNMSAYVFCNNNPVLFTDKLGLSADTTKLQEVVVTAKRIANKAVDWFTGANVNYSGSGWGHGPRRWIAGQMGLGNTANSLFEMGLHSQLQSNKVQLVGGLLDKLKADPAMVRFQKQIVKLLKSDPRFGKVKFVMKDKTVIGFGGDRWTSSDEDWGALDSTNPALHGETWGVAGNELTWAVRHASVGFEAVAKSDGTIVISYQMNDKFDLSGQSGRSGAYNNVSNVTGFMYHDVTGGNSEMQVSASWDATIK